MNIESERPQEKFLQQDCWEMRKLPEQWHRSGKEREEPVIMDSLVTKVLQKLAFLKAKSENRL